MSVPKAKAYISPDDLARYKSYGYLMIAMQKDSHCVFGFTAKNIKENGRLMLCPGLSIPAEGNSDYLVLEI